MKSLILIVLQIIVFACGLGAFASLANYVFGWNLSFKGAEAPADLRAVAMFVVVGGISAAIVYLAERKRDSAQNQPE